MRIILASASPRRKELLASVCRKFEIIIAETDETLSPDTSPENGVEILACRKGSAVADKLLSCGQELSETLILSSDTLVEIDGVQLGKPKNKPEAFYMLKSLSGRVHNVRTGVAVHYNGCVTSGVATTAVVFRKLTDDEIWDYIETGEPMDKAGAYGIQGLGGKFVDTIDGDFDTVVGLPIKLTKLLAKEITGEWVFGEML